MSQPHPYLTLPGAAKARRTHITIPLIFFPTSPMRFVYFIFCILTAMVGYHLHHSILWGVCDFLFAPLVWAKWLVLHQVSLTSIKATFSWFWV